MKMKHILGTATIILIAGGIIYGIKKAKDAEKDDENAISAEEARAMVEAHRKAQLRESTLITEELMDEIRNDAIDMAGYNESFMKRPSVRRLDEEYEEEEEEEEEDQHDEADMKAYEAMLNDIHAPEDEDENYEFFNGIDAERPLIETMTEEDKVLRHAPSSIDARNQFMKMELAEWVPLEDTYQTMLKLFEFPFQPTNDGDADLFNKIVEHRAEFFGWDSKWVRNVSLADVILYFARLAVFNQGEDMRYWVNYFLDFNELDSSMSSRQIDEVLALLNNHVYFNEERATFGLFGLTRESMDQAIRIANRNIDRSVTYEIEFNEFLKSCI